MEDDSNEMLMYLLCKNEKKMSAVVVVGTLRVRIPHYALSIPTGRPDLIVLGFNYMSTLVGHFVSSPREREKRDGRDSRRDEREEQGRKRNRNESEETEETSKFHGEFMSPA